ncbi:MAG: response regulator, partial [Gemmatimonadota bacterium]
MSRKAPNATPLSVLIVEHDPADIELCILELQRGGFEVYADVVDDTDAFIARLANQTYDVILSDYRLPGWNGMEALQTLRAAGLDIPFILVTGT